MVSAENYALNNECAPNNEVLCISTYHSVIHGKRVSMSVNVKETSQHMVTQKPSTAWKASYMASTQYIWTPCLGERLSLRTDMGNVHDSYHTMLFR